MSMVADIGRKPGEHGAAELAEDFRQLYGSAPLGVFSAPGRLNLAGEYTDFNDGFALPFATPQRTRIALARRTDSRVVLASRQLDQPVDLAADEVLPGSVHGWAAYPLGSLWSLRQAMGDDSLAAGGLSVLVDSDLPVGAGLASSAALVSSMSLALNTVLELGMERIELARAGQRAENLMVGAPTGILDHMASLLSRAGSALLLDCRAQSAERIPLDLPAAGLTILAVNSGVTHALNDGGYGSRRQECLDAARAMGVAALRDADEEMLAAAGLPEPMASRARHVVSENARVLRIAELLREGRVAEIGPVISASQPSMRDDIEVSVPELDLLVDAAVSAGALGASIVGGGFGGSVEALVERERVEDVRVAVTEAYARLSRPAPAMLEVTPAHGADCDL